MTESKNSFFKTYNSRRTGFLDMSWGQEGCQQALICCSSKGFANIYISKGGEEFSGTGMHGSTDQSHPLYQLTEKGHQFPWKKVCENSFQMLRKAFTQAPLLAPEICSRHSSLITTPVIRVWELYCCSIVVKGNEWWPIIVGS